VLPKFNFDLWEEKEFNLNQKSGPWKNGPLVESIKKCHSMIKLEKFYPAKSYCLGITIVSNFSFDTKTDPKIKFIQAESDRESKLENFEKILDDKYTIKKLFTGLLGFH
jgi:hypothetical protein